jgi:hypothetical protein
MEGEDSIEKVGEKPHIKWFDNGSKKQRKKRRENGYKT